MISGPMLSLVALVGVSAAVPHLLARDALRTRLVKVDTISTFALLALWHLSVVVGVSVRPALASGVFLGAKLLTFAAAFASDVADLEWSPSRAGVVAALVYMALIPNVLAWRTEGDESYYVLMAESMLHDFDLDLRNQYAHPEDSVTNRGDLRPQFGDPVGPNGELYSRHEPLLPLLLLPGLALGGLPGAVATIAILAALAVRATITLLEEEGVGRRTQLFILGFVGLAPPLLNYAVRVWPEAAGALLLAEMLRAARNGKNRRLIVLAVLLSALKIRFIPIAAGLLVVGMFAERVRKKWILVGTVAVAAVLGVVAVFFPGVLESRAFDPWTVLVPDNFAKGFLGVLIDGQGGLLFQAPLLLIGFASILRWRVLGRAATLGCLAALPYVILLLPRSEWHGGWSPPLRYLVVFLPVFALLLAGALERIAGGAAISVGAAWTAALAGSAVAGPPRVFRIASGESALGEYLSRKWGTDFTSLIPSLIRPNEAAMWFAVALAIAAVVVALRRRQFVGGPIAAAVVAVVVAGSAWAGLAPGNVVEFEDAHVQKRGGELHPERWTVARFRFRGGWLMRAGDVVSFRHDEGMVSLTYYCDQPTVIEIDGVAYDMSTGTEYQDLVFVLPKTADDRHELRCVRGALILDYLATE